MWKIWIPPPPPPRKNMYFFSQVAQITSTFSTFLADNQLCILPQFGSFASDFGIFLGIIFTVFHGFKIPDKYVAYPRFFGSFGSHFGIFLGILSHIYQGFKISSKIEAQMPGLPAVLVPILGFFTHFVLCFQRFNILINLKHKYWVCRWFRFLGSNTPLIICQKSRKSARYYMLVEKKTDFPGAGGGGRIFEIILKKIQR